MLSNELGIKYLFNFPFGFIVDNVRGWSWMIRILGIFMVRFKFGDMEDWMNVFPWRWERESISVSADFGFDLEGTRSFLSKLSRVLVYR